MIKLIFSITFLSLNMAFSAEDSKLVTAVNQGTDAEVRALAKDKTELSWKDSSGFDALFYAVSLNDIEKVKILLKAGASTANLYTDNKESLLFEASRLGSEPVIKVLIKKDPSLLKIKNSDNESPLFVAVREDQSPVVRLLAKKGLSLKEKNKSGKTPADYVDPKNKKMVALFKELKIKK
jgi:ankyrin repeat protein